MDDASDAEMTGVDSEGADELLITIYLSNAPWESKLTSSTKVFFVYSSLYTFDFLSKNQTFSNTVGSSLLLNQQGAVEVL